MRRRAQRWHNATAPSRPVPGRDGSSDDTTPPDDPGRRTAIMPRREAVPVASAPGHLGPNRHWKDKRHICQTVVKGMSSNTLARPHQPVERSQ